MTSQELQKSAPEAAPASTAPLVVAGRSEVLSPPPVGRTPRLLPLLPALLVAVGVGVLLWRSRQPDATERLLVATLLLLLLAWSVAEVWLGARREAALADVLARRVEHQGLRLGERVDELAAQVVGELQEARRHLPAPEAPALPPPDLAEPLTAALGSYQRSADELVAAVRTLAPAEQRWLALGDEVRAASAAQAERITQALAQVTAALEPLRGLSAWPAQAAAALEPLPARFAHELGPMPARFAHELQPLLRQQEAALAGLPRQLTAALEPLRAVALLPPQLAALEQALRQQAAVLEPLRGLAELPQQVAAALAPLQGLSSLPAQLTSALEPARSLSALPQQVATALEPLRPALVELRHSVERWSAQGKDDGVPRALQQTVAALKDLQSSAQAARHQSEAAVTTMAEGTQRAAAALATLASSTVNEVQRSTAASLQELRQASAASQEQAVAAAQATAEVNASLARERAALVSAATSLQAGVSGAVDTLTATVNRSAAEQHQLLLQGRLVLDALGKQLGEVAGEQVRLLQQENAQATQTLGTIGKNLDGTTTQVRELFFGAKAVIDELKRVRAGLDAATSKLVDNERYSRDSAAQLELMSKLLASLNDSLSEQVKALGRTLGLSRVDQGNLINALDRVNKSLDRVASGPRRP